MDNSLIFRYNTEAFGGTEYMAKEFHSKILPELKNIHNYKCVIFPGFYPDLPSWGIDGKQTILWLHNTMSQFHPSLIKILNSPVIKKSIAYIIAVSEYHKQTIHKNYDFPNEKIIVIPNAIDTLTPVDTKFANIDKVKIIHASSMDRGLETLLNAIPLIKEDFELNVFNNFYPEVPNVFNKDAIKDPRVTFWGKTPRDTVHKFMSEAHIHAYPSTYPETSCLAQMEALSAGCYCVYTDLGALNETSLGHGTMLNGVTPQTYANALTEAIKNIKEFGYDYTKQVEDIKNNFTWEQAKQRWLAFDAIL